MMNQPRVESQEATTAFVDNVASRPIPQHAVTASAAAHGSVSVGQSPASQRSRWSARRAGDEDYWEGRIDGKLVDVIPKQALEGYETDGRTLHDFIERGRQRFNVSCMPCHDHTGSGNGMVARRGFKYPPSYHTIRLRAQPIGYLFNVATHGRGQMAGYGDWISTDDRWAIAAYVRTLQFSQYAPASVLNDADLARLNASPPAAADETPQEGAGP